MFKYYVLVLKCRNELIKILQSLVKVSEFILMLFILISINFIKIFAERRKNLFSKPSSQRDQPFNALKRLQDLRK